MLATLIQFAATKSEWLIVVSMCLVTSAICPCPRCWTPWINRMNVNGLTISYGPARAFGSVAGAASSLLLGF
jgi:hypothetical protein